MTFIAILPQADKLYIHLLHDAPPISAFNDLEPTRVGDPKAPDGQYRKELFDIAGTRDFDMRKVIVIVQQAEKLNVELQRNGSLAIAFNDHEPTWVGDPKVPDGQYREE